MSAPDQAFTKAYGNQPSANAPAATRQAIVRMRAAAPTADALAGAPLDHLYADGALYRMEVPQSAEVPAPHYAPPVSQQRTVQRRVAGRHRAPLAPPIEPAAAPKPPLAPPAAPRRTPALGLAEIARRMAHAIPPVPSADLPPEVVVVEEPVAAPIVPVTPAAPTVNQATAPPVIAPQVAAPPVPSVVAPPTPVILAPPVDPIVHADPLPSAAAPVEDVATLVEVCTPWESINDAVTSSLVILTDPPAISPATQALIQTALDPILSKGREAADAEDHVAEPGNQEVVTSAASAAEAQPAAQLEEFSVEKKYRLDPPQPQGVQAPHIAAVPDASAESQLPKLAELTPEETESLLGEAPADAAIVEAAPAAQVMPAQEPLVPMWEVDRFQWPSLCDRLMKDEQSYFAQAGGKLLAAAKDGLKTLGITGSRRGEGRTTLALCLARCAAQSGLNVAMIDADFTRPQLAAVIGLEVAYGWQDAAQGKIPLPEAAVRSLADKITVLPLEASSVAWPLALADKRVSGLIRAVAAAHDLVIVDLGPLSGGNEPLFAADEAPPLDAVIVLRDMRYATPSETQAVGQRLHDSGVEAVGIAENFVPAEKPRA